MSLPYCSPGNDVSLLAVWSPLRRVSARSIADSAPVMCRLDSSTEITRAVPEGWRSWYIADITFASFARLARMSLSVLRSSLSVS